MASMGRREEAGREEGKRSHVTNGAVMRQRRDREERSPEEGVPTSPMVPSWEEGRRGGLQGKGVRSLGLQTRRGGPEAEGRAGPDEEERGGGGREGGAGEGKGGRRGRAEGAQDGEGPGTGGAAELLRAEDLADVDCHAAGETIEGRAFLWRWERARAGALRWANGAAGVDLVPRSRMNTPKAL